MNWGVSYEIVSSGKSGDVINRIVTQSPAAKLDDFDNFSLREKIRSEI